MSKNLESISVILTGMNIKSMENISKTVKDTENSVDNLSEKLSGLAASVTAVAGTGVSKLAEAIEGVVSKKFNEELNKKVSSTYEALSSKIPDIFKDFKPKDEVLNGIHELGTALSNTFSSITGISIPANLAIAGLAAGIILFIAGIIDLWNTSETFRDNVMSMLGIIGEKFAEFKQKAWDEGLKPLWDSIKEFFASLYQIYEESGLKDIFEMVVTGIGYIITEVIGGLLVRIGEFVMIVANNIQTVIGLLNFVLNCVKTFIDKNRTLFDGLKQIFRGVIEFISGVFTGDWSRAWNGVKEIFRGVMNTFEGIAKLPINAVIALCEMMANGIISAFNGIKRTLNKLSIKIPDWVPEFGGQKFGFNLEMTSKISLPRYAKGGFPNTGEMFIARENGITEMVGRMGTKAAVANNDQIVAGIASGVRNAIVDAVAEVAVAMNGNQGVGELSPTVDVLVKVDSETIYRMVQRGRRKAERRYEAVVPVG
ncbi:hypothetical protein AALA78_15940 [Lachnospiraceae bacterium 42-17]